MNRDVQIPRRRRRRLQNKARRCREAQLRTRYMIVVHLGRGKQDTDIAESLGCCERTVRRVRFRWKAYGEAGLMDQREDNAGQGKVTDQYLQTLSNLLEGSPQDHGFGRPRWTLRLLAEAARERTGISLSRSRLSRILRAMGVRWGRPKPFVECPWSRRTRQQRLRMIRSLIDNADAKHPVYWEDEVDIDLNPRIGFDWTLPGQQRQVRTPGKNVKRYIAGAMHAGTDHVTWVEGHRKNSSLFIDLLKALLRKNPNARVIHVVLDNYKIHSSKQTQQWLQEHGHRIRLHFLPPYCPDENRIERKIWRDVHENVTYNHKCGTIEELMENVTRHLHRHNRRARRRPAA